MTLKKVVLRFIPALLLMTLCWHESFAQTEGDSTAQGQTEVATDTAATSDEPTFESMLASLNDIGGRIKLYNETKGKTLENFQLVDVRTLVDAGNQTTYDEARTTNERLVTYLQDVAGKINLFQDFLADHSVTPQQVVAMDVTPDADVVIFYDSQSSATGTTTGGVDQSNTNTDNTTDQGTEASGQDTGSAGQDTGNAGQDTDTSGQQDTDDAGQESTQPADSTTTPGNTTP